MATTPKAKKATQKKAPAAKAAPAKDATERKAPAAKAKPKFKVTATTEVDPGPEQSAPPKTAEAKVPGVRAMRTRPYLAGRIIAAHGLAAGVTDAMVAELDNLYGKPNAAESRFCLKNAWHACRAYAGVAEDSAH